jgi:hypothetical protein
MVESLRIGICPPQTLESHPRVDAEMTRMCVRTFLARECARKKSQRRDKSTARLRTTASRPPSCRKGFATWERRPRRYHWFNISLATLAALK